MIKQMFLGLLLVSTLLLGGCSGEFTPPDAKDSVSDGGIYDADISSDGSFAVVTTVDSHIQVWSLSEHKNRFTWRHQGDGTNLVDNVHISADQSVAITADSEAFAVWDVESGEPIGFWRIDESTIRDVAISNQGKGVLVGRANGTVLFFEPDTGRRLEFLGHTEKVNTVDISPNGKFAITGSNDYKAYLWSTQTGQVIHVFNHTNRVTMVSIDDQARYLFTADSQDDATIWDAQTGDAISRLNFIQRQIVFTSVKFSDDGTKLLTGSPARRLALWDVATGDNLEQWRVAPNNGIARQSAVVYGVGFNENGVISIASSGNVEYWHDK
jgi:WD40 repeat protein